MRQPRVLMRSDSFAGSGIEARLRESGNIVTKIHDDRTVERLAATGHADAVVIDLALVAAIGFARRIEHHDVPYVIVSDSPNVVRRLVPHAHVVTNAVDLDDIVRDMVESSKIVRTSAAPGDTLMASLI